jgi:hypothetical protein
MRSQYAAIMQHLTELWSSSEACDGQLEGCSEAEIAEIMKAQGVERLPLMYVEFLRHMGRNTGGLEWYFGSELTYPAVCIFKSMSFWFLSQALVTKLRFVFTHDYQGDCSIYFDPTEADDPILYRVAYDSPSELNPPDIPVLETQELGLLSDYLTDFIGDVIEEHRRLKNLIDRGAS